MVVEFEGRQENLRMEGDWRVERAVWKGQVENLEEKVEKLEEKVEKVGELEENVWEWKEKV